MWNIKDNNDWKRQDEYKIFLQGKEYTVQEQKIRKKLLLFSQKEQDIKLWFPHFV